MDASEIKTYYERTGYRFRDIATRPVDEHVARYMASLANFSATGVLDTELERSFETISVVCKSRTYTRSDGSASLHNQWIAQVRPIPGLRWQVIPAGQRPELPVEVPLKGGRQADYRIFTDNPQALATVLANPALSDALSVLAFVSLSVADGVATFSDHEQRNFVAASGGMLGLALAARGQKAPNALASMELVHDQIADLLWAIARSHAAYPQVESGSARRSGRAAPGVDADAHFPVICRSCGAPATPRADFSISCSYCGQEDQLPAEEKERSAELQRRVQGAARATAHLEGIARVFTQIFEYPLTTILKSPWVKTGLPIFAIVIGATVLNIVQLARVDPESAGKMSGYSLAQILQFLAIPLAGITALLATRPLYAARLRPIFLARPPRIPGQPMRCRACGGSLADGRAVFVPCEYCRTENLVSPVIQTQREGLLQLEENQYRKQTRQAVASVTAVTTGLKVTFVTAFLLIAGGAYLLSFVFAGR